MELDESGGSYHCQNGSARRGMKSRIIRVTLPLVVFLALSAAVALTCLHYPFAFERILDPLLPLPLFVPPYPFSAQLTPGSSKVVSFVSDFITPRPRPKDSEGEGDEAGGNQIGYEVHEGGGGEDEGLENEGGIKDEEEEEDQKEHEDEKEEGEEDESDTEDPQPHWTHLRPASHCLRYATRDYFAVLTGVPYPSAITACRETAVEIHGMEKVPDFCQDLGSWAGVWGHWTIDFDEQDCITVWVDVTREACVDGIETYSAKLENLKPSDTENWRIMCATTPVRIDGRTYPTPSDCIREGDQVIGLWEITDPNDNEDVRCRSA